MGFFSDLTGATAAKGSTRGAGAQIEGLKEARGDIGTGISEIRSGIGESLGYLQPFAQTGQGGLKLLVAALGINGPQAQQQYFANFQNDPGYLAERNAGVSAVEQGAASGGSLRSGGTLKALQEYGQRFMRQSFLDRLGALSNVGQQGQSAAGGIADIRMGGARDILGGQRDLAQISSDTGTARASGIVGAANAKTAGSTNIFNAGVSLLGSAAKASTTLLTSLTIFARAGWKSAR